VPASAEPRPGQLQELTRAECFLDRHTVVFRTEPGTKLHAAGQGGRVCFEADGTDAAARTGWSVIIRGEITEVTDRAELARLRELSLQPSR
jgi:nitroimidazol reductase NimA-like FMN-containing flavoprotein (pyridoxamine 5'-phosphate oxidase superfamily)